jgi:hypothetical protein
MAMLHQAPAHLSDPLLQTLAIVADALMDARDPWWLIGGAAVGLQGVQSTIPDVDVLTSPRDARQVLLALDIRSGEDGGTALFRSNMFGRWTSPPLPVEFMGGFQIRMPEGWRPVEPVTREAFLVDGRIIYAPARTELIRICRLFGRPKDLARAEALARLE